MYRDSLKFGFDAKVVEQTKKAFSKPLAIQEPSKIFASSWTDVFHPDIDKFRKDMWAIIKMCPQHTFQILTKRPERILDNLPPDWGDGYPNVWLGTSIGNQEAVYTRFEALKDIPAKLRFISFEPLHEPIDFNLDISDILKLGWAIIGGESGNETGKYRYRPCEMEWIESLLMDLFPLIPVFIKQTGTYLAKKLNLNDRHGGDFYEWPKNIQIREFPKITT